MSLVREVRPCEERTSQRVPDIRSYRTPKPVTGHDMSAGGKGNAAIPQVALAPVDSGSPPGLANSASQARLRARPDQMTTPTQPNAEVLPPAGTAPGPGFVALSRFVVANGMTAQVKTAVRNRPRELAR